MKYTSVWSEISANFINSYAEFNLAINLVFYRYITENNSSTFIDFSPIRVNSVDDLIKGLNELRHYNFDLFNFLDTSVFYTLSRYTEENLINRIYTINLEEFQTIGNTLIDRLIEFEIANNKSLGIYSTPKSVGNIISQIVANHFKNSTALTVYNPCVGLGSLIIDLSKYLAADTKYFGEDLNSESIRWAKMRLIVNRILLADLREADVLEKSNFYEGSEYQKFDIVVTNPPFGLKNWRGKKELAFNERWNKYPLRMDRHSADSAFLIQALDSLINTGIAAIILPNNFMYNVRDKDIRKYLLHNRLIEGVIHLPNGIFNRAMISTSIVFLSKNNNENVFFIDANKEFVKDKFQNVISDNSIQKIVETWKDRKIIKEFSNLISIDTILEEDGILDFKRYDVQKQIESSNNQFISLENIVKIAPRSLEAPEELKLVRIKNLADDPFNYLMNIETLETGSNNGR